MKFKCNQKKKYEIQISSANPPTVAYFRFGNF